MEPAIVPTVVGHVSAGARWTTWPLGAAYANNDHLFQVVDALHPQVAQRRQGSSDDVNGFHRALVRRGDVTVWLAPDALATWQPTRVGVRGGQRRYSDAAIETTLTLRLIFHLPLRQAEGFLTSLFRLMHVDLSAPDHTTLTRRGQSLDPSLRRVPSGQPLHLFIDSPGLTIMGQGEWAAAKHGSHGKRRWSKLHLAVDDRGVIVAQAVPDDEIEGACAGCG